MRRAVCVVLVLLALTACEKTNSVASSVSPCFRVLPAAHQAVGGQGTFVDVARVNRSVLSRLGIRRTRPSTTLPTQSDVCLIGYKGSFDPSRIPALVGPGRSGPYAVVVVGIKSQKVRAVVLLEQLPHPLHKH
jgi:hypothetical protein